MTKTNDNHENATELDLQITRIERRAAGCGTWVIGTIDDRMTFNALVFPAHAESEEYEIGKSRISKLWVQRISDKKTLYNWDRGLDVPAQDTVTQIVVDFLCVGLAELIYA